MRHRFTFVFLVVVCAVLSLTTYLASAGTAGDARYARTSPTATSQTTAVTLASRKNAVDCTVRARLTGKVTPAQGGVQYEVWMKPFNRPAFEKVGTSETRDDGSFSLSPLVCIKTAFQIRVPTQTGDVVRSNVVTVNARAYVYIERLADIGSKRRYVAGVRGLNLGGRFVLIQRAIGSGRWVTLRRATLRPAGPPSFMTAPFSLGLPRGNNDYLRAFLPRTQAAPAHVPSVSRTLTVRR